MFAAALIALACALVLPAAAGAESFEVNSTADETDVVPGNEFCLTAVGKCTLRAAIEEANSTEGEDRIFFEREMVFAGQVSGTISLGTALPPIVHPIAIEGECVIADVLRPCVGVDGPGASEPALTVENTEAEIFGLAITGAETGIEAIGTPRLKILSDWLGVKLDGSAGGNETGVLLGKGSENVRIGSEGVTNVFANNDKDGLDIHGADGVRVMSGYFGVEPDGITPAPNGGKDIEAVSVQDPAAPGTWIEAAGNRIGTQLTPEAAASPACDGGCNVIAASGSSGIDLEGDGDDEGPATGTIVAGNYIGLDASGTVALANAAAGVNVGPAGQTVIGGIRASEANRFAGGEAAVVAGPGAANLVVRGNWVGFDAEGGSTASPEKGIVVHSEGLPTAAAEATIAANEIRMNGGIAIDSRFASGLSRSRNLISRRRTPASARAAKPKIIGNLVQENRIDGSSGNGILVESTSTKFSATRSGTSGGRRGPDRTALPFSSPSAGNWSAATPVREKT